MKSGAQESSPEIVEHFWSQDEFPEAGNCPRGSSIESRDGHGFHPLCEFRTC